MWYTFSGPSHLKAPLGKSARAIIGTLNIDSAKTKIDAGVANLIRVSLSIMIKRFPNR